MRKVLIEKWAQLRSFTSRLHQSRFTQGRSLGPLIMSLHITLNWSVDDAEPAELTEAVIAVLSHASMLVDDQLYGKITTQTQLLCLVNMQATLTAIDLDMAPGEDGAFPIINHLTNLRLLHLSFLEGDWSHSLEHPVKIAAVTSVQWLMYGQTNDQAVIFLSLCCFGAKCEVNFRFQSLRPAAAHHLRPFFTSHSFAVCTMNIPSSYISILAPEILRAPDVHFWDQMPLPQILQAGPVPPKLTFAYSSDSLQLLWDFLGALAELDNDAHRYSTVRIQDSGDTGHFCWVGGSDPDQAPIVGRLVALAVTLRKRGIAVVDECDNEYLLAHQCISEP